MGIELAACDAHDERRLRLALETHAALRQERQSGVQLLLALLAGGIAYVVPVFGVLGVRCADSALFSTSGCADDVPGLLVWALLLPALGLYAFLITNQLTLERYGVYLRSVESDLRDLAVNAPGTSVPMQVETAIVSPAYAERPFGLIALFSQLAAAFTVTGAAVVAAGLLPYRSWLAYLGVCVYTVVFVLFAAGIWKVHGASRRGQWQAPQFPEGEPPAQPLTTDQP